MARLTPPRVVTIDDLRRLARRRLPRAVFDYIEGGAEREVTLRENRRVFDDVTFRPRQGVAVRQCDLTATVLETPVTLPVLLAPVGSSRLFYPRAEEVAAREAGAAGSIYVLSTLGGCRLEDVRRATPGAAWYQLYLVGGREAALAGIARARAAGYGALVVTLDTPVAGLRERDVRNGVKEVLSGGLTRLPYVLQFLRKPRWLLDFFRDGGLMHFPNVIVPGQGPMAYLDVEAALRETTVTWDDIGWIRGAWGGPLLVKGVLTAADARRALTEQVDGIIVSNHGGRQLDSVSPALRALPEVVAAAGPRVPVLMDGGVRSGADVVKALCLGARAVLVGRAYAYGLGAAGGDGVRRALEILRADMVRTMTLLGCASVQDLDRSYVDVPADWDLRRQHDLSDVLA